jgi:pilus assembly protein CpaF
LGDVRIETGVLSNKSQAKGPVFAIVISEKGGAERRETFEQPELNIGRVQGNELMLPKGNVSKRHARLVYRDGRFIVTDLNSTNGTYVNRRRISQATIVRQGDRIYIGDFVLRIESQEESSGLASARSSSVAPIPLREPMMTTPDTASRSKAPPAAPTIGYPPVPPAPRVPGAAEVTPSAVPSSSPRGEPSSPRGEPSSPRGEPSSPRGEPSVLERPASTRDDSIDTDTTAYRSAIAALVDRVLQRVEPKLLDGDVTEAVATRVDRAMEEQLAELRREEVIGAAIVEDRLKRDARAELLELGVIGPLLEDDTVTDISVAGASGVTAIRAGRRVTIEPPLSSDASVRRVLGRLARLGGAALGPDEHLVSRKLPSGFHLTAIAGPRAPTGTLLRLDRAQRVDATLDDLVRAGAVSRGMATFLRHCIAIRANILVVGPRDARPCTIAGALASASPDGHVVALQDSDFIVSNSVTVSHIDVSGAAGELGRLVDFAGRLPDARLVVDNFSGATAAAVLDAVAGGADGLVAVANAASLRRGLARLPADLAVARAGLSLDAAREWLASTFDIVIDVARLRDGRQRVIRVGEPAGVEGGEIVVRDVFSFVVERTAPGGSVEGTFQPTGVAPRVVNDMAARGISVDSGVFSRPPSR